MTIDEEYRPRLIFEISREQQRRVNLLLNTYGLKKSILSIILDDLLDLIEEHGNIILGVILDGAAKPREVMPVLNKAERKANGS